MILIEQTDVYGWEAAVRGMRNPKNSWEKSDSLFLDASGDVYGINGPISVDRLFNLSRPISIGMLGPDDHDLMMRLANGGPVHAKYRRFITVTADITAPLYWWKEFDTYKVGTVSNSCSTMHKIASRPLTIADFSYEELFPIVRDNLVNTINLINEYIDKYKNETNDETMKKCYWMQIIQLLPTSYNQRRTVLMNYEVLVNIFKWRENHKLSEWRTFCNWIKTLPYSELITGDQNYEKNI